MRLPSLLTLSLSLFLPTSAYAQHATPQQTAAAQTLYEEATGDLDAKRYASACRKLEDVTRLVPDALGAKLTLGECYERVDKLASAWEQYTLVGTMAPKTEQPERVRKATAKAAALQPRLATLDFKMSLAIGSIPGLVIRCDGAAVDHTQWWEPLPIDVGSHEIVVTAPGGREWKTQVDVTVNGKAVPIAIELPALKVVPADKQPPRASSASAPTPEPTAMPAGRWQRPVGLTAMGLGAVGGGVGGVLGFLAMMQHQGSNNDRKVLADGAIAATIAGGVMLAGGMLMFATTPSARESQKSAGRGRGVQAQLELLPCGFGVRGTW